MPGAFRIVVCSAAHRIKSRLSHVGFTPIGKDLAVLQHQSCLGSLWLISAPHVAARGNSRGARNGEFRHKELVSE